MTREEANYYLKSSGFSDEQIETVAKAYTEPKTGHWKQISPARIYECDICGQNVMTDDISAYRYCHGCGAKMVEPQESEEIETWNGIHAQITAPKGTFERIFNDADDDNDI